MDRSPLLWALVVGLAAAGCSVQTDVGKSCVLSTPDGGPVGTLPASDFFLDQGDYAQCPINGDCLRPANFSGAAGTGVCSNSCTPPSGQTSGPDSDDCGSGQAFVCGTITLSPLSPSALADAGISATYCVPSG